MRKADEDDVDKMTKARVELLWLILLSQLWIVNIAIRKIGIQIIESV